MVREAYFDAPNLGRLIQDVWNNPGFVSPDEARSTRSPPGFIGDLTEKIDSKSVQ
ncbi:hypothetical protein G3819_004587 [Escherichia coli]|nr:hypothetical protein [Escherichia coli]BDY61107.1 hypothetical protein MUTS6_42460 [Escherichia coli]